jgi:seryl-tRNA synthetase
MLQINYIRQNVELVKERLSAKYFSEPNLVDTVIELDDKARKIKVQAEVLQSEMNAASKEIGMLMGKGDKEAAEQKKQEVSKHKQTIQELNDALADAETAVYNEIIKFPNLPHTSVPKGKTPEENEVVRELGDKPTLHAKAVPHWDLIKQYDLVDFETGVKLTGSGFPLYKGRGAKLQRALIQYF